MMQAQDFLINYMRDLDYWLKLARREGMEAFNNVTSGTPEFETYREAKAYVRELRNITEEGGV